MRAATYDGRVYCWPKCIILAIEEDRRKGKRILTPQVLNQSDEFTSVPVCAACGKRHDYVTLVRDNKKVVME